MGNVYQSSHPLVAHKLSKLRNVDTEPRKFRELVREISALMTYEATADLGLQPTPVTTPLTEMTGQILSDRIGLIPVLWGSRRMNAMGVLLLPIALNMAGAGDTVARWLGLL